MLSQDSSSYLNTDNFLVKKYWHLSKKIPHEYWKNQILKSKVISTGQIFILTTPWAEIGWVYNFIYSLNNMEFLAIFTIKSQSTSKVSTLTNLSTDWQIYQQVGRFVNLLKFAK